MRLKNRKNIKIEELISYRWWWYEQAKDFYFFNRIILGHFDMNKDLHLPMCRFITKKNPKGTNGLTQKLLLIPRSHLKSSCCTIGYPLYKIAYWDRKRPLRILIANGRFSNAQEFLAKIQTHIEKNQLYRQLYRENLPTDFSSKDVRMNTEQCRWVVGMHEVKIDIASPQQGMASRHYDLIIFDDLINEDNYKSETEMERIKRWFKLGYNLIEPGGEIIVIGTRWSDNDLYAMILDNEEYRKQFDVMIKAVWKRDENGNWLTDENGERIPEFPEKFSPEYIKLLRATLGPELFASQMLNDPVDESVAVFKKEWLRYYERAPENLNIFMAVDPARTTSSRADYTAFVVAGMDAYGNIYVLRADQKRLTYKEIVDEIFRYWEYYQPRQIGLEYDNYEMLYQYFLDERKRRQLPVMLTPLKTRGLKKEERIKRMQPYFEDGRIFLGKNMDELVLQLLRFPKGKHDDLIDALAYAIELMYPPDLKPLKKEFPYLTHVAKEHYEKLAKKNQLAKHRLFLYPYDGGA